MNIKLQTQTGAKYPADLQNLSYDDAVNQLDLLADKSGTFLSAERPTEDVLILTYADGYETYTIED